MALYYRIKKKVNIMVAITASRKIWLFRGLTAFIASLMIISFVMPWWTVDIYPPGDFDARRDAIRIYGFGLQEDLGQLGDYVDIQKVKTPFYQMALAWIYIGVNSGLMLYSTWLENYKGRLLLGGIGFIYIAYAVVAAFVVITSSFREIGLTNWGSSFKLQGWNTFTVDIVECSIYSKLRLGFYLALAVGGVTVIIAFLYNIIIKKAS
jgi:hypothetical protein